MTTSTSSKLSYKITHHEDNTWLLDIDQYDQFTLNDIGVQMLEQALCSTPVWMMGSAFWSYRGFTNDGPCPVQKPQDQLGKDLIMLLSTDKKALEVVADALSDVRCWDKQ